MPILQRAVYRLIFTVYGPMGDRIWPYLFSPKLLYLPDSPLMMFITIWQHEAGLYLCIDDIVDGLVRLIHTPPVANPHGSPASSTGDQLLPVSIV